MKTPDPPSDQRSGEERPAAVVGRRAAMRVLAAGVVLALSLFVVRGYVQTYDSQFGWTQRTAFGADFEAQALPRLRTLPHHVSTQGGAGAGYDGQFYAQLALDPALRDPDLAPALDSPAYRARRIGLPAVAYALGLGDPARILQAYALSNLLFWFVLLGAACALLRPGTVRALLCLSAATLCLGAITSMQRSLVDLPAAALVLAGLAAAGTRGGPALLAAAVLTRETNLLAAGGFWDGRPPWRGGGWRSLLTTSAAALVPLILWTVYVNARLGHHDAVGDRNFAWPLQAMWEQFATGVGHCAETGFQKWWRFKWLYKKYEFTEPFTVVATLAQGMYFVLRRDARSPLWRAGVGYLPLGLVLGPAVWADVSAAARVLLPMTICFYFQLARERGGWCFWLFFALGSLSLPYAVHDFWMRG